MSVLPEAFATSAMAMWRARASSSSESQEESQFGTLEMSCGVRASKA